MFSGIAAASLQRYYEAVTPTVEPTVTYVDSGYVDDYYVE